jgi:hypothetical protein
MAIRHDDFPLLMKRTNGAHNGQADDAASDNNGENDKAHGALRVD